jgi:hypothetical protein
MNVFWSTTDHKAIRDFGEGGWIIATVFNQKREMKSCFFSPDGMDLPIGRYSLFLDDFKTEIEQTAKEEWQLACEADYKKNVEDFAKVNPPRTYPGKSGTTAITGLATGTTTSDGLTSIGKKPDNMTRKEWKNFKKGLKEVEKLANGEPAVIVDKRTETGVERFTLDDYGFDMEERKMLAEEGWSLNDIDEMIDRDFTATDILRLAQAGYKAIEIEEMMDEHQYDIEKILMGLAGVERLNLDIVGSGGGGGHYDS